MKLIFSGGLNKFDSDSWKKSYFYKYSETIRGLIPGGLKVCFVTLAKPDHYFDEYIIPQFGESVDIIGNETESVNWGKYDLIFLCGGDTVPLKMGLLKKGFNFKILKKDVVILGDSAGAMLLAPYFYETKDRKSVNFIKGIYPKTKTIIVVHVDNPAYCNNTLIQRVGLFAAKKDISTLKLKENETKLFDEENKKFVDFKFDDLFSRI